MGVGGGGGGGGGACMHLTSSFRLQGYLEVQEASELGNKTTTPYEDPLQTMYSHALHQSAPLRGIGKGTVDFEYSWSGNRSLAYNACSKSKEINLCSALQPKQDDDTKIVQNNATPACMLLYS